MANSQEQSIVSPDKAGPILLDTTLRDGSYTIDFQFTVEDTSIIASILERAGLTLIEVGHGVGLDASATHGQAAESDEAYIEAAVSSVSKAKVGCFFIPGIAKAESLKRAADLGMGFVRIGTNATEIEQAEPFIRLAKDLGLWVSSNLMKSYVLTPAELAVQAAKAADYGVDLVCLVDSAGGMLPDEITEYYRYMRRETDVALGYHGHNNLGLGVYNTLKAAQEGAAVVDVSLQGIGRSAGNASTEQVCLLLKRCGMDPGVDINLLMDAGSRHINPLLRNRGVDSLDVTSGYAQFHSSYMGTVLRYAKDFRIDPRELIVRLCAENKVEAPPDLLERLSHEIAAEKTRSAVFSAPSLAVASQAGQDFAGLDLAGQVSEVGRQISALSRKWGKLGVFNVILPYASGAVSKVSPFVQSSSRQVIGGAVIASGDDLRVVGRALQGLVDTVLLDCEEKTEASAGVLAAAGEALLPYKVLRYQHLWTWAWAIVSQVLALTGLEAPASQVRVAVLGKEPLAERINRLLSDSGFVVTGDSGTSDADYVLACGLTRHTLDAGLVEGLPPGCTIIDAGGIGIAPDALEAARSKGLTVLRRDIRPFVSGLVEAILGVRAMVGEIMGRRQMGGQPVVAGGVVGSPGEIVIDSISQPSRVIGVADGRGGVRPPETPREEEAKQAVHQAIMEMQIRVQG